MPFDSLSYAQSKAGKTYQPPVHGYQNIYDPINNYIYLYHTDTLILLPNYPSNLTDSSTAQFSQQTPLGRSAPIYSYQSSGPRSISFQFELHREMLDQVNVAYAGYQKSDDYVELLVDQIQAAVLPTYAASQKMVDPPLVAVRVGNDIYIKGVINGTVSIGREGPILKNDKYAKLNISFTVSEVDPYDALIVQQIGSFRNPGDILINTTLDQNVYVSGNSKLQKKNNYATTINTQ